MRSVAETTGRFAAVADPPMIAGAHATSADPSAIWRGFENAVLAELREHGPRRQVERHVVEDDLATEHLCDVAQPPGARAASDGVAPVGRSVIVPNGI